MMAAFGKDGSTWNRKSDKYLRYFLKDFRLENIKNHVSVIFVYDVLFDNLLDILGSILCVFFLLSVDRFRHL